jgi:hypothetical protein
VGELLEKYRATRLFDQRYLNKNGMTKNHARNKYQSAYMSPKIISHNNVYLKQRGGFMGGGGGGGAQGCAPLLALVNKGAIKSNSEIWHNFHGFSFFEVKLKLIIQCPYHRKWHF